MTIDELETRSTIEGLADLWRCPKCDIASVSGSAYCLFCHGRDILVGTRRSGKTCYLAALVKNTPGSILVVPSLSQMNYAKARFGLAHYQVVSAHDRGALEKLRGAGVRAYVDDAETILRSRLDMDIAGLAVTGVGQLLAHYDGYSLP
jgi:hypothetical protein